MRSHCRTPIFLLALLGATTGYAALTETPEEQTLRISKMLKPIPNDEWKKIAGDQVAGKYEITQGDTLYDVSKRLFGDSRYWPKIWALNNDSILNPHIIRPGNRIAFMPGTGTSLPTVEVETSSGENATTATDVPPPPPPGLAPHRERSDEWRMLPPQEWEAAKIEAEQAAKKDIQVMGSLDKLTKETPSLEIPVFSTSKAVEPLGKIISAPAIMTYLRNGDQVLIRGSEEIKPGEIYSLISEADSLEKREKARQGYAYRIVGEIQITGNKGDLWVGVITETRGLITRDTPLIPRLPRLKDLEPIAAPAALDATFYLNRQYSTYVTGQFGYGFVNLGSEDGIQEGMIFESVITKDGVTDKSLGKDIDFHSADLQVVQVSERFSTVRVIAGSTEIPEGAPLRLLTDVSRFQKSNATPEKATTPTPSASQAPEELPAPTAEPSQTPSPGPEELPPPVAEPSPAPAPSVAPSPEPAPAVQPSAAPPAQTNELDQYDQEDHLKKGEEKELKQLEQYKAKVPEELPPPEGAPQTAPLQSPSTEDLPPPPPAESAPSGGAPSSGAPSGNPLPPSEPQVID